MKAVTLGSCFAKLRIQNDQHVAFDTKLLPKCNLQSPFRSLSLAQKHNQQGHRRSLRRALKTRAESSDCECDFAGSADVNGTRVTGATLRAMTLTDVGGSKKALSEVVGEDGKAVVVFLRHLG
mmetsp:Transcript_27908/g.38590  ORF Transcript_27908/g.38590 Transcript_27908/m.38590 type:complete len:123 (+) Transcript_27908:37-405(+)